MSVMTLQGGVKRILQACHRDQRATGPGRVAFSRDATGELVVLPLTGDGTRCSRTRIPAGFASHQFFICTSEGFAIFCSADRDVMDRFMTGNEPGLLILHGYGNVFETCA